MINKIISEIINPSKEFTPIPFWFLNDELDRAELKRRLEDFNEKGVNGVVLHPRIGIPESTEYLSEEYFDIIRFIVKTAKELDMLIVLYDEAMYPSGSAHGLVVKSNPDFASVGIKLTDNPDEGKIIAAFDDGYFIVSRKCGGTIRGIHFGEDDGEENAPLSADILNPDAVDKFINLTHDAYYSRFREYFGNTIIGFFTDEPCILGRNSAGYFEWTDGFENDIIRAGGKPEELRGLFDGEENETVKIYRRLIRERLNNVYYKRLYDWCGAHGVALMGHPKDSGDIDEERFFHIPGQDLVFRWVSPENGGTVGVHSVQAKCSSDAARHSGKRRNMNECFGVCSRENIPWYFTADDMKWYIDWLGVRGVNMFVPHAFYYSLAGKRKDERPPDVGPNNIWWRHYKLFSDYIKRVSYIMTDSENCAKTAVLCESGAVPYESIRELYERQIEFNYLPYSLLNSARAENGRLKIAGYEYKYIIGETKLPIKSIKSADEIDERDFRTGIPAKDLRVSHLIKRGVHMYFIVNEGENDVGVKADMPLSGTPVAMDLWSGEYYKMSSVFKDGRTYVDLSLARRESLLILFDTDGGSEYPAMPEQTVIDGLDFKLIEETGADIAKAYTARYEKQAGARNEYLRVKFDEMAECYVNGIFCGASFFNRGFRIGEYLTDGINEIRLVITGNIANKFSNKKIPYGLKLPDDFIGA